MGFRDLTVWQRSKTLAIEIYQLTNQGPITRDFGLRDQIRRAAVSVPSNIAEGDERDTNKESVRYLYIAKGSTAELLTQLEIAYAIGYLHKDDFLKLYHECEEIACMIGGLIKVRRGC